MCVCTVCTVIQKVSKKKLLQLSKTPRELQTSSSLLLCRVRLTTTLAAASLTWAPHVRRLSGALSTKVMYSATNDIIGSGLSHVGAPRQTSVRSFLNERG
uniref:Uncharacterized protein n=1 Tax=Chromera velia CCMP2878 TaxID=1169474 RepID=A0A0G4I8N6_9ALVE|eukprot:Cvel_11906.t1-p1 / transcript=Cvel_11906.t1 / gene=Cvel_11906 / organism=Chromera_velia_CCMP2878 / gene_product=hypothetical protein / transcript_product=hypothetical protein / location=Cvel_scaffold762:16108-17007(-) / protein_length=99 / sequence_SO=supercontig / SO=protein_coding / is_pseudo=false